MTRVGLQRHRKKNRDLFIDEVISSEPAESDATVIINP